MGESTPSRLALAYSLTHSCPHSLIRSLTAHSSIINSHPSRKTITHTTHMKTLLLHFANALNAPDLCAFTHWIKCLCLVGCVLFHVILVALRMFFCASAARRVCFVDGNYYQSPFSPRVVVSRKVMRARFRRRCGCVVVE